MGCCGDKRKAWKEEVAASTTAQRHGIETYAVVENRPERIFEYTGTGSLMIQGASSGVSYHFRFPGDRISVDYHDSFGMMAEVDLKPLPLT